MDAQTPLKLIVLHSDSDGYLHDAELIFDPAGRSVGVTLNARDEHGPYQIDIGDVHTLLFYLINHIAERENALFKQVVGHPKPNPTANPPEDLSKVSRRSHET